MKKTKLLTSIAALALVVSLGACETGDIIIEVGDVTLGDNDSDTTDTESGDTTTSDTGTGGDTGTGEGGDTGTGGDTGEGGEGNTPTNALTNYTLSITLNGAQGEQTTIPEYATAYVVGDWDNWAEFLPLTEKEDKTYEYTFSSIDVGTHEFKGVMWYSDETVDWEDCVEIITGTGSNGNASFEVDASEGDNFTKYLVYTLTATLEEKGSGDEGNTPGEEEDKEAELVTNLIASVNQLVEECEDEGGLSVWEALHVVANDVEDDTDYISTTRTYDLGTEEDVAFGVVDTYTSNDNYTTTRYYTGEGKYYEKTSGGYGSTDQTGIHSTSKGSTYASIADILGYYLEDYLGAIDDSGTLEDYTSTDWEDYDYTGCYRYSLTDDEDGLYYYYIDGETESFVAFIYDNGEEAYEDGWERVEFTPTTEEEVRAKLDELDYESWPVSGVQLQFNFYLNGVTQTIPEGVTLYYVEGETRTAIEQSSDRYVVNPSSLEQGTHTYSIVLVADEVEETIATGTYDITFDDGGLIKQLTVTLTQAFEDYLGGEEDYSETIAEIVGSYTGTSSAGATISLTLYDDYSGVYDTGTNITWSFDGTNVTFLLNGDDVTLAWDGENKTLIGTWLQDDYYEIGLSFAKVEESEQAGDPYDELIATLETIEPNFDYASEFGYESDYYGADGSETVYSVLANSENVGYSITSDDEGSFEYYSDGENTYSYDGTTATKEEVFYGYEVYQGTAEQAFMWDLENIVEEVEAARDAGWIVDDESTSITIDDSKIEVYLEGSTYDDFIMLYAYYDDDGTFSSFDYMSGNADGDMRYIGIQNYNVTIDAPDWLELVSTGTTINDVISALTERGTDFDFGTGFYYDSIDYSLSYYYETECTSVVDAGGYYLSSSYNFDGDGETITYTDLFGLYSDTELTWLYSDGYYGYSLDSDSYVCSFDDFTGLVDFASVDFEEILEGLEAIASTELDGDEVIVISDELIYLEAYAADGLSFVQLYVTYDEDGQITSFIYQYGTKTTVRAVILTSTDSIEQPEWSIPLS